MNERIVIKSFFDTDGNYLETNIMFKTSMTIDTGKIRYEIKGDTFSSTEKYI